MNRRIARKIAKRINAGAQCPRRHGRGYTEATRYRAHHKLVPHQTGGVVESFDYGRGLAEILWDLWWSAWRATAGSASLPREQVAHRPE